MCARHFLCSDADDVWHFQHLKENLGNVLAENGYKNWLIQTLDKSLLSHQLKNRNFLTKWTRMEILNAVRSWNMRLCSTLYISKLMIPGNLFTTNSKILSEKKHILIKKNNNSYMQNKHAIF